MNNHEEFILETKRLEELFKAFSGFEVIFKKVSELMEKHSSLNKSFQNNIEQLSQCNTDFTDLNADIKQNILNLREIAVQFPEKISSIKDENKKVILDTEQAIKNAMSLTEGEIKKEVGSAVQKLYGNLKKKIEEKITNETEKLQQSISLVKALVITSVSINIVLIFLIIYLIFSK